MKSRTIVHLAMASHLLCRSPVVVDILERHAYILRSHPDPPAHLALSVPASHYRVSAAHTQSLAPRIRLPLAAPLARRPLTFWLDASQGSPPRLIITAVEADRRARRYCIFLIPAERGGRGRESAGETRRRDSRRNPRETSLLRLPRYEIATSSRTRTPDLTLSARGEHPRTPTPLSACFRFRLRCPPLLLLRPRDHATPTHATTRRPAVPFHERLRRLPIWSYATPDNLTARLEPPQQLHRHVTPLAWGRQQHRPTAQQREFNRTE